MRKIREQIYQIISPSESYSLYDIVMMVSIFISLLPLVFKRHFPIFAITDGITTALFIIDYALRWITADIALDKDRKSFLVYPFTASAIIDLLSILPGIFTINKSLKLLRLIRMVRIMRMFRIFKAMRYSKNIILIANVLSKQKGSLISVCIIAGAYIIISALVVFNVEPDSFNTFFDAIYWATVSLTTVGYGDIYPVTTFGRIVTMLSSIFGIAIVAMPAGIITAGLMEEIGKEDNL